MPKGDKLTKKQEDFLKAYLSTLNPMAAYRQAYDTKGMSDDACRVEGNKLLKHPLITLRVANAAQKVEAKDLLTLEKHMQRLEELSRKAETLEQISAAVKAEELRGKLQRFYVEQVEHGNVGDFDRMNEDQLLDHIERQEETIQQLLAHNQTLN